MINNFVYQIYPRSFNDTTGNGIGDINGIIEKLSYIKDLGADYIWITPFFVSPQNDNGYDIANYLEIDPLFGTMSNFDTLVEECKKYGLKIMLDMVLNHTSTEHEWFKKAMSGDKEYQDFYFFQDDKVNWESKFGGNAFEYVEEFNKYYLHLFDKTQADLNWENEKVRAEIYNVVNFWLDKGVEGLRFDVINLISKKHPFVNSESIGKEQYTDGPRVHEFLKELNKNTFGKKEVLTVGEMSSTDITNCKKYANSNMEELSTVFHFHHLKVDYKDGDKWTRDFFDFKMLKELFKDWQEAFCEADVNDSLFWSNHDQPRIASRFVKAKTEAEQLRKNKMLAASMYLMRGVSFIFQGEEIGMLNCDYTSINDFSDVESINYYNLLTDPDKLEIIKEKSRDNSRTPMQWDNSLNSGFTTGKPWLKVNSNYETINVGVEKNDPNSTLSFYKELIKFKKENMTLVSGNIKFIDHEELLIYTRSSNDDSYTVVSNYFDHEVKYEYNNVIMSNFDANSTTIPSFGFVVIKN